LNSGLKPCQPSSPGAAFRKAPPVPVVLFFGPTGSGKTRILIDIFAAPLSPRHKGAPEAEIISADSVQVYRGMDIGAAKPSLEERNRLPHHLIDIRNPDEQFSAGDFVRLAAKACADIYGRGKLPVISGGTGFYFSSFMRGLPEAPPSDPDIRAVLKEEFALRGAARLMEELRKADPVSAGRIHINDTYRLLRALEVFRLTGRALSSYAPVSGCSACSFLLLGLSRRREELYRRINERCAAMFKAGLPDEVRRLVKEGYGPGSPGLKAIGYREFFTADGILREDFDAVEALTARNSRRYAKRQLTWFKALPETVWINADAAESAASVEARIGNFIQKNEFFLVNRDFF
jgi:tRNA dimethylallyltransferase